MFLIKDLRKVIASLDDDMEIIVQNTNTGQVFDISDIFTAK